MALSKRLQLVFDQLIPQQDVWDICCDHGYLGGAAYKSKKFNNIYFVDSVPSIMTDLELRFRNHVLDSLNPSQAYFLTQEAQSVQQPINGTVTILGVGGLLIYNILETLAQKKVLHPKRLILGPHRDVETLLLKISQNEYLKHYQLSSKFEVKENARLREFFIFDQATG